MLCPVHELTILTPQQTRYGVRYSCPALGCTVACWSGSTSTPADAETRAARSKCHDLFDPLWKRKSRFKTRGEAYRWLQVMMDLPKDRAHIGMFNLEQCQALFGFLTSELAARQQ